MQDGPLKAKLVRDKLPGQPVNSRAGKHLALCLKLHEEAQEIAAAPDDPDEYADLIDVALELARINGVTPEQIKKASLRKEKEKGRFRLGLIKTKSLVEEDDTTVTRSET